MKRYITIIIILLFIFSFKPAYSYGNSSDEYFIDVKVGANVNLSSYLTLSSDSGFAFYDKYDKDENLLQIQNDKIIISGNLDGIDIFDINYNFVTSIPGDGSTIIGSNDRASIVQVEKNKYRDYISFLIKDDQIYVINHIEMEHYLYGVVPKEIPASSHMEALKAQAIVARSFALAGINKHINEGYNLCDKSDCQVYGAFDNEHPSTNQAIDETRGIYVYYDGKVVSTPFHSTSGGYTEDSSKVWGGTLPYLVSVEDSFSSNSPNSSWTIKMTPREIGDKLLAAGINIGEVLDMEILSISEANRVQELKIKGSNGDKVLSGEKLRSILGSTFLKSAWFNIDKEGSSANTNTKIFAVDANSMYPTEVSLNNAYILDARNSTKISRSTVSRAIGDGRTASIGGGTLSSEPTTFVFNGRGYGHGVGMSQYGAIEMAKLGYNYSDIITYYFKGVEVTNK